MKVKVRIVPDSYTYSSEFHVRFSSLCKAIKKTAKFYASLAAIKDKIVENGIEGVIQAIEVSNALNETAREYFESMKDEIPKVGLELQGRVLVMLMSL